MTMASCVAALLVAGASAACTVHTEGHYMQTNAEAGDPGFVFQWNPSNPSTFNRLRIPSVVTDAQLATYTGFRDSTAGGFGSAANLALGVAGLAEVKAEGVENYDVSDIVNAHHKYRHATGAVLQLIGLEESGEPPCEARDEPPPQGR